MTPPEKENIYNIPNALSLYRLLIFPYILYLAFDGQEKLFALFLCISLITDILDGAIARGFHLKTNFGARLDSLADIGVYILALYGVFKFKSDIIGDSILLLWIFLISFFSEVAFSFIKFGKNSSLHLYSSKISGYLQGIFFFLLFAWHYQSTLFFIAMIVGIIARVEEIIILAMIDEMQNDVKGLYWVLKSRKLKIK